VTHSTYGITVRDPELLAQEDPQ